MLFGGVKSELGEIKNDEEFEKYKMQFVDHYNEEHKDLYKWRKTKKGKKPITSEKNIEELSNRSPFMGNSVSYQIVSGITTIDFQPTEASSDIITTDERRAPVGTSPFHNLLVGTPVILSGIIRPPITTEDAALIDIVEARGEITPEDRKRLNKKYGKSLINEALKKYRKSLLTRPLRERGWRD